MAVAAAAVAAAAALLLRLRREKEGRRKVPETEGRCLRSDEDPDEIESFRCLSLRSLRSLKFSTLSSFQDRSALNIFAESMTVSRRADVRKCGSAEHCGM